MQEATYVIKSKNVFTGNADRPFAGGVAVSGDTIVAVGPDKYLAPYIGEHTEVRDFGDSLVMPGLIDSHTHFAQGAMTTNPDFCVNLIDCTSFEQCMERVVTFADAHPDNEWILGIQIIQFQWAVPEMPTAKMIDEYISDRPVFLQQVDLHTYSVNTCALEKLGITDEVEDPQGGKFLRDADGHLTGVLSNNAAVGFTQAVYNPPDGQGPRALHQCLALRHRAGHHLRGRRAPHLRELREPLRRLCRPLARRLLPHPRLPLHRPLRPRDHDK